MRPSDWPEPTQPGAAPAPIDLRRHDLPHPSSMTEWWYVNAHLDLVDGRRFAVFAAFFRIVRGRDEKTHETHYAHSLTWALIDLDRQKYYSDTLVDRDSGLIMVWLTQQNGFPGSAWEAMYLFQNAARELQKSLSK